MAVLWCLALLSVVVIGVLHTSRMNLLVVKNHGDRVQAHYLAVAGIEKAKALLYQDARQRSRTGLNHSGQLSDSVQQFRDIPFARGAADASSSSTRGSSPSDIIMGFLLTFQSFRSGSAGNVGTRHPERTVFQAERRIAIAEASRECESSSSPLKARCFDGIRPVTLRITLLTRVIQGSC